VDRVLRQLAHRTPLERPALGRAVLSMTSTFMNECGLRHTNSVTTP
jgi:hypothetical protein